MSSTQLRFHDQSPPPHSNKNNRNKIPDEYFFFFFTIQTLVSNKINFKVLSNNWFTFKNYLQKLNNIEWGSQIQFAF
jgi:hypothetical protein